MAMIRIFAFGTLKRGLPLHDEGLHDGAYRGSFRTVERFPLLTAGPWFAPMMLDEPGTGRHVKGELYEVAESRLVLLGRLESVGKPGNFRRLVEVEPIGGGVAVAAYAYIKAHSRATPVHTACLGDYQDRRFVPPALRS
jgi:gamma-glutamylaminecyclotransferase